MRIYQDQRLHNSLCRLYCWIMHHMWLQGVSPTFLVRVRDRRRPPSHLLHLLIDQVGWYCPWRLGWLCWAWFCDRNLKRKKNFSFVQFLSSVISYCFYFPSIVYSVDHFETSLDGPGHLAKAMGFFLFLALYAASIHSFKLFTIYFYKSLTFYYSIYIHLHLL